MRKAVCLIVVFQLAIAVQPLLASSKCYGTTSNGALSDGCKLPSKGSNFESYSILGSWFGRTYVHCTVAEVVATAYESVSRSHPDTVFVYGESGLKAGGQFKPHKTHQNGLSVDFMVPVTNVKGESVPLPRDMTNKFGYDLEFNGEGKLGALRIDFEAIAIHLEALKVAAERAGIDIWRVIFDPQLQPYLKESPRWPALKDLKFSERRSWVRHDEHYHVDFEVPCAPLKGKR